MKNRQIFPASIIILLVIWLLFTFVSIVNAGTTDSGEVAATIGLTTSLTAAAYPTNTTTGTPVSISDGTGCTDALVVDDLIIDDNSINAWTLTVTTTNGAGGQAKLLNETDSSKTIDYSLEIGNVAGTLATGLTLSPAVGTALTFSGTDATISPAGTATTASASYQFDLLMTIADGATTGKLAGDYADTLNLTLASDD